MRNRLTAVLSEFEAIRLVGMSPPAVYPIVADASLSLLGYITMSVQRQETTRVRYTIGCVVMVFVE